MQQRDRSQHSKAIDYSYLDGVDLKRGTIDIPASSSLPDLPSFFLFAFAKSGSALVNALVRDLLTECGVPRIDLPSHLWERGIHLDTFQCDIATLFPLKGYCFAGFRDLPPWLNGSDVLRRARKLVIVRDPRDMLVSLYYSFKHSHWFPEAQTPQFEAEVGCMRRDTELSLDEFCMAYAWAYNRTFWRLDIVLRDENALVLRYEDFVYDKVGLAKDICRWCGINVPEERIREFAAAYGAIPKGDEPDAHVRQVHPGDHKRKLRPHTIAVLNTSLANFLGAFSYTGTACALERAQHGVAVRTAELAEVELLRRERDSLRHERDRVAEDRDRLRQEQEILRRERDELQAVTDAVRASTSWRITARLRRIGAFLARDAGS